jgi:hypothetical protein
MKRFAKSVPQLMRGDLANTSTLTDARDHSPQRLPARPSLRILSPPHSLPLRNPLLNFDGEYVVI